MRGECRLKVWDISGLSCPICAVQGEQTAILNTIGAMTQCLEVPEGCRVSCLGTHKHAHTHVLCIHKHAH